jgi:hypothetical protein
MCSRRTGDLLLVVLALLLANMPVHAQGSATDIQPDLKKGSFIVHEWGTFLSVQGSNGEALGGMVDSDEVLPPFVETRSIATWQRSMMRTKGETPVTYFYTDRPRVVQVKVDMPEGLLTHWYPSVCRFGPAPSEKPAPAPSDSYIDWCYVALLPVDSAAQWPATSKMITIRTKQGGVFTGWVLAENDTNVELIRQGGKPQIINKKEIHERFEISASAGASAALLPVANEQTWRYVRETDSALVRVQSHDLHGQPVIQDEKFLFYRGLGTFSLPFDVRSSENQRDGLHLNLSNHFDHPIHGLFAIRVDKGTIQYVRLADLDGKASRDWAADVSLPTALPLDVGVQMAKDAVAEALQYAGLYAKEARAMVNTWERSYFRTDGLRLLYIVPRERVDAVLPIHIKPAPDKLVRVMVGRIEVLTPSREQEIEKFVSQLGASDFSTRQAASAGLAHLGRLGEPALRRVMARSTDPEVRARAEMLINGFSRGQ